MMPNRTARERVEEAIAALRGAVCDYAVAACRSERGEQFSCEIESAAVVAATNELVAEVREADAVIAETLGAHPAMNIYGGGPDWFKHGAKIAATIRARR
jgi:hypothetical protein